jgi:hypothetical protein
MSRDDDVHRHDDPALLSAEDDADVARLLQEAAEPVAMPPEVVDRLDAVLAGLVAERLEGAPLEAAPTDAAPLDAAPLGGDERPDELAVRRRRWPRLMLAAAAVVIGGYGVSTALAPGGITGAGGGDGATSAEDGVAATENDLAGAGESRSSRTPVPSRGPAGALEQPDAPALLGPGNVRLRPEQLEKDVRRVLAGATLTRGPATDRSGGCRPPVLGDDESWTPARYAGRPAVLVTDSGTRGIVDASVYSCGGKLLASVTVDAP